MTIIFSSLFWFWWFWILNCGWCEILWDFQGILKGGFVETSIERVCHSVFMFKHVWKRFYSSIWFWRNFEEVDKTYTHTTTKIYILTHTLTSHHSLNSSFKKQEPKTILRTNFSYINLSRIFFYSFEKLETNWDIFKNRGMLRLMSIKRDNNL